MREFGRADNGGGAENNEYYGSLASLMALVGRLTSAFYNNLQKIWFIGFRDMYSETECCHGSYTSTGMEEIHTSARRSPPIPASLLHAGAPDPAGDTIRNNNFSSSSCQCTSQFQLEVQFAFHPIRVSIQLESFMLAHQFLHEIQIRVPPVRDTIRNSNPISSCWHVSSSSRYTSRSLQSYVTHCICNLREGAIRRRGDKAWEV